MKHAVAQRTLVVQPDDGVAPVLGLIADATQSLRIKQFTLSEPRLVQAIIDAHRRGVAVRVMLNPHRSSGDRPNDACFEQLQKTGMAVQWTSPDFVVTHEKSIVVDDARALIATFNLVLKYFTETRDYGIITSDPAQVAQVAACFDADWQHVPFHPGPEAGLLWSVTNARPLMAQFIEQARHSLDIQHPKFVDATILERLVAAQERGVHVRLLCGGRHGLSDYDVLDTFASLRILGRAGIRVHRQKQLKLHAKLILADGARALLGSMNIDRNVSAVTHADLALCFLKIALVSFGGGLSAWARQVIVEEHQWLTNEEFLTALTLARLLPGPNVTNMAVYVGTRFHGLSGACAALAGLTLVPLAILLGLGVVYFHYHRMPAFQAVLTGLVAAGAGLTLSMAVKSGLDIIRQPVAVALAVAAFIGVAILRWPLLLVLGVLAPIGLVWYWPREAKHGEDPAS